MRLGLIHRCIYAVLSHLVGRNLTEYVRQGNPNRILFRWAVGRHETLSDIRPGSRTDLQPDCLQPNRTGIRSQDSGTGDHRPYPTGRQDSTDRCRRAAPPSHPRVTPQAITTPSIQEPNGVENEISLSGRIRWDGLASLFGQRSHPLQREVDRVSVMTLAGDLVVSQSNTESYQFRVPANAAYLLKVRTVDGANLWALTSRLAGDAFQDVSLETTYEAGLIYAAEVRDPVTSGSAGALKESAALPLFVGADRLVNTVKRVVNNALFWSVDYSIFTELNESNLRAFGGDLGPVRSLDSLARDPQPDYVPHIFMLNISGAGPLFLDRILMSELKADRWTAIVVAEDIPPRVYRGLGGLDVAHGGTDVVYGEAKCFQWNGGECQFFRQALVTYPLDPSPSETPTVITRVDDFDGAHPPNGRGTNARSPFTPIPTAGWIGRRYTWPAETAPG